MITERIVFGGGCFWCTEAVFDMLKGVVKTEPGYAGGTRPNPTYEEVCRGDTGHAEVLLMDYDPNIINLEKLLDVFFEMHDPTTKDRQGADMGSEYRSIILYTATSQREVIDAYIKKAQKKFDRPISTEIKRLDVFYPAEDYHKKFYEKNPLQPYCVFVTRPKVAKIRKEFGEIIKK